MSVEENIPHPGTEPGQDTRAGIPARPAQAPGIRSVVVPTILRRAERAPRPRPGRPIWPAGPYRSRVVQKQCLAFAATAARARRGGWAVTAALPQHHGQSAAVCHQPADRHGAMSGSIPTNRQHRRTQLHPACVLAGVFAGVLAAFAGNRRRRVRSSFTLPPGAGRGDAARGRSNQPDLPSQYSRGNVNTPQPPPSDGPPHCRATVGHPYTAAPMRPARPVERATVSDFEFRPRDGRSTDRSRGALALAGAAPRPRRPVWWLWHHDRGCVASARHVPYARRWATSSPGRSCS